MGYFDTGFSKRIVDLIAEEYGDELEFLWANSPDSAIVRHDNNRKWYAVFMNIQASKLGLPSDDRVDIIDVKCGPLMLGSLVDNKTVFRGYHMNKNNWITVLLDGSAPEEQVMELIALSYDLTAEHRAIDN